MNEQKQSVHLSGENMLVPIRGEKYYQVAETDWERLKSCVEKIQTPRKLYELIGSVLLGVLGAALLSTVNLSFWKTGVLTWREIVTVVVIVASGLSGGLLMLFSLRERKLTEYTKDHANEEIALMEKKWQTQVFWSYAEEYYGGKLPLSMVLMKQVEEFNKYRLDLPKEKDEEPGNEGKV